MMKNKLQDQIARDLFQKRINKGMLGPGSDVFVREPDIENEIIGNYPLQQYYTGILFPEKQRIESLDALADCHLQSVTDNEDEQIGDDEAMKEDSKTESEKETDNPVKAKT